MLKNVKYCWLWNVGIKYKYWIVENGLFETNVEIVDNLGWINSAQIFVKKIIMKSHVNCLKF